jgi:ABC-type nitrate/sulfonate/bicarbonate transport system ATPase subunit
MSDWLEIDRVTFGYGRQTVFNNLSVSAGDNGSVLVVVGANGIGKSTLIRLLAGHLRPRAGAITLCGELVRGPAATRPVVFQDHNLLPWMTVLDNVVYGLKCAGVSRAGCRSRGEALLQRLQLQAVAHSYPATLSGGTQQRIGVARALAVAPTCLLMDEPFSALDPNNKELLVDDLQTNVREHGIRLVIVTHNVDDAVFLGNQILLLRPREATVIPVEAPNHPRCSSFRASSAFTRQSLNLRAMLQSFA